MESVELKISADVLGAIKSIQDFSKNVMKNFDKIEAELNEFNRTAKGASKSAGDALEDFANESTKALKKTSTETEKLGKTLKNDLGSSINTIKNLQQEFMGLLVVQKLIGVFHNVVSAIVDATKLAGEFSLAMAEVKSISGQTSSETAKLSDEILKQSNIYGTTAKEQAKTYYQILSAGITESTTAQDVLSASNKLAVGGLANVADAVDILTTAVNVYGAESFSATQASDYLFQAVKDGKTTVSELANSLGQVLPLSKNLGVSFQETAGAVAALTSKGIATSEAVTGLKSVFAGLLRLQGNLKKENKAVQEAFSLQAIKAKGLEVALKDMSRAVGGSSEQLIRLIGTQEGVVSIQALASDGYVRFGQIMQNMANSTGAADKAFRDIQESLGFQQKRLEALKENLTLKMAMTGDKAVAAAVGVINDTLESLMGSVDQNKEAIQEFVKTGVLLFIDTAPTMIRLIGLLSSSFTVALSGVTLYTAKMLELGSILVYVFKPMEFLIDTVLTVGRVILIAANSLAMFGSAVGKLTGSSGLVSFMETLKQGFKDVNADIMSFVAKDHVGGISAKVATLGLQFENVADKSSFVTKGLIKGADVAADAFEKAGNAAKTKLGQPVEEASSTAATSLNKVVEAAELGEEAFAGLGTTASDSLKVIVGYNDALTESIKKNAEDMRKALGREYDNTVEALRKSSMTALQIIKDEYNKKAKIIRDAEAQNIISHETAFDKIIELTKEWRTKSKAEYDKLMGDFAKLSKTQKELAKDNYDEQLKMIEEMESSGVITSSEAALAKEAIWKEYYKKLGLSAYDTLAEIDMYTAVSQTFMQKLIKTIDASGFKRTAQVIATIADMVDKMWDGLGLPKLDWTSLSAGVRSFADSTLSIIKEAWKKIGSIKMDDVVNMFKGVGEKIKGIGSAIYDSVKNAFLFKNLGKGLQFPNIELPDFEKAFDWAGKKLTEGWEGLKNLGSSAIDGIVSAWDGLGNWFAGIDYGAMLNAIGQALERVALIAVEAAKDLALDMAVKGIELAKQGVEKLYNTIIEGAESAVDAQNDQIKNQEDALKSLKTNLEEQKKQYTDLGKTIGDLMAKSGGEGVVDGQQLGESTAKLSELTTAFEGVDKTIRDLQERQAAGTITPEQLVQLSQAEESHARLADEMRNEKEAIAGLVGKYTELEGKGLSKDEIETLKAAQLEFANLEGQIGRTTAETEKANGELNKMRDAAHANVFGGEILQFADMLDQTLSNLPEMIEKGITFLADNADKFVELGIKLVDGIIQAIPKILDAIIALLPKLATLLTGLIKTVIGALPSIIKSLTTLLPALVSILVEAVMAFVTELVKLLPTIIPALINTALAFVLGIIDALPQLIIAIVNAIPQIIMSIIPRIPEIVVALITGIINAMPELIQGLIAALPALWLELSIKLPLEFIKGIVKAIPTLLKAIVNNIPVLWDAIMDGIKQAFNGVVKWVKDLFKDILPDWLGGGSDKGGGGGGNIISKGVDKLKGLFGYADGGTIPADMVANVHKGELVVPRNDLNDLRKFMAQGQGNQAPQQIILRVGERELANVMVNLNRNGYRTA